MEREMAEMGCVTERVGKGVIATWCLNGLRGSEDEESR